MNIKKFGDNGTDLNKGHSKDDVQIGLKAGGIQESVLTEPKIEQSGNPEDKNDSLLKMHPIHSEDSESKIIGGVYIKNDHDIGYKQKDAEDFKDNYYKKGKFLPGIDISSIDLSGELKQVIKNNKGEITAIEFKDRVIMFSLTTTSFVIYK